MRRRTFFWLLLRYLLISSVNAAARSSLFNITPVQNRTISNVSSLNDDFPVPWGPSNFHAIKSANRLPIPAGETFMLVLAILYHETPQDFNGRLPESRMIYRTPLYPHVEIGVVSTRRDRRVPRKYLFWTLARVLESFVGGGDTFTSTDVVMELSGVKVGTVFFVALDTGPGALKAGRPNPGFHDTVLALPSLQRSPNNGTVASFGTDDIEWDFSFEEELLKRDDIFMGTIAALIDVARHDEHSFDMFIGSWPGYEAFILWYAHPKPTRLTKLLLIQSIVSTAYYANRQGANWHALRSVLYVDKQQVASGGYTGSMLPPPGAPGFDSFS